MDETGFEAVDSGPIRILHLDDEPAITDLTAAFLEKEFEEFETVLENAPDQALERLRQDEHEIHCVVSDYDMQAMDGLEFLEEVRKINPDLPFILFTGKGSEEIASEAISRGVTDYLQKESGSDQYTVLGNRIRNAVAQYRAEREVEKRSRWYQQILKHSSDYVMIVDNMGLVKYVSPAIERVMGFTQSEIIGTNSFENVHPDDREYAATAMSKTIEEPTEEVTVEFRAEAKDGSTLWLEARGSNFFDDPIIEGIMVNVRDITKRKNREQALERQKERLQELTGFLSHDVQNQLSVVSGYIDLAQSEEDMAELDNAVNGVKRIEQLIDQARKLAQSEEEITEYEEIELSAIVEQSWETVAGADVGATVTIDSDLHFQADRERIRSLIENLLVNAVEHAGTDVSIHVGAIETDNRKTGFYVADDGPGIAPEDREKVFDSNYTTTADGAGLGLAIVTQAAEVHGWNVEVTESAAGGARFEVTGVVDV